MSATFAVVLRAIEVAALNSLPDIPVLLNERQLSANQFQWLNVRFAGGLRPKLRAHFRPTIQSRGANPAHFCQD
jgi:hypothetical protein